MENLDLRIQQVMDTIKEEEIKVASLRETRNNLIAQQEEKIKEVAIKLLPVMQTIRNMGYRFHADGIDYMSKKGAILGFDKYEDELYVFDIEHQLPCIVDVRNLSNSSNNPVNYIGYSELLSAFDFPEIMDNLLSVLDHYQDVQKEYQNTINKLEDELNDYENVL
ncbi:hypothetical protein CN264_19080 [Bacillus cereus]|uniref:hypothetical protein n=1 Tax=Bacillus cereus TaxID=1396 RepID=UPI000BF9A256|nr:hypothetical protein [Bacillus cereus]PFC23511.1 hypothetical protein CN264_19080 [Bacillus cereus]